MSILNPSFESAGGDPGSASSWARGISVPFIFMAFTESTIVSRFESFEASWGVILVSALDATNTTAMIFDPLGSATEQEGFERGWESDETAIFVWDEGFVTLDLLDGFESGWATGYLYAFAPSNLHPAGFTDSGFFETFELEWLGNEAFAFTWPAATADTFGPSATTFEGFESVKADQLYTVDPSTSTFTAPGHGFGTNDRVSFRNDGGDFPSGINPSFEYFVVSVTVNTFKIAQVANGIPDTISDVGSGSNYVKANTALFWTTTDVGV